MHVTPGTGVTALCASALRVLAAACADVVALGSPGACAGCGRPGSAVCETCQTHLSGGARLHQPSPAPAIWAPTHVVAEYAGITRSVINAWKERGRRDVAEPLARALAVALDAAVAAYARDAVTGPYAVVPIPSSASARRRRGEDAWGRVVRRALAHASSGSQLRLVRCLDLTRQPRDQADLTAVDRMANLDAALRCVGAPAGPVIVVDDIVTSGATLAEATRALLAAGVDLPRAAAIAATSRTRHRPSPPHW